MYKQIIIFLIVSLCGCAPYRQSTERLCLCSGPARCPGVVWQRRTSCHHWLYRFIPRHRCQIAWYDVGHWCAWALFGNDLDGLFGEGRAEGYKLCHPPSFAKAVRWWCRNPLHNFTWHVVGNAHCKNSELTLLRLTPYRRELLCYRPVAATVFASRHPSLYLALHGGKPFCSLRLCWNRTHELRFYAGWRARGNLGFCFAPFVRKRICPGVIR